MWFIQKQWNKLEIKTFSEDGVPCAREGLTVIAQVWCQISLVPGMITHNVQNKDQP